MLRQRLAPILAAALLAATPLYAGTLSITENTYWVKVQKVYDGDTFRTDKGEKIRLLGINTPEITHDTEPGEPFGSEAGDMLRKLLGGQAVRLTFDIEKKDRYGRTLAQVYLRDGTWINEEMLKLGMAHVYTFPPNLKHVTELHAAERIARDQSLGIWANSRFKVLSAKQVSHAHIGQYRIVEGEASKVGHKKFGFRLGKISISVPRKYRKYFAVEGLAIAPGQRVMVRGTLRTSSRGQLFLAIHAPSDMEVLR